MRYPIPDVALFIHNREKLVNELSSNSIVVLGVGNRLPHSGDTSIFPFKPNPDFYYLTGIDQEESILLLCPEAKDIRQREILFIKPTHPTIALWEGDILSKDEVKKRSGIQSVYYISQFEDIFNRLAIECEYIYLNTNEHSRASVTSLAYQKDLIGWCKKSHPLHTYKRLAPLMRKLRMIKSDFEVNLIREACMITGKGIKAILPMIDAGTTEFEIEAALGYEFLIRRSRGFAYEPIIASGKNACILHYTKNEKICQSGELILMDVGATYGYYKSDVTRTFPVDGIFTSRQKQIYEAVLKVLKDSISLIIPGNSILEYQHEVGVFMQEALLRLGLISQKDIDQQVAEQPAYRKYFMHGISHHLGLDVHDVSYKDNCFETGMVLTVEPGIYIQEEGIGIRLEDDIAILEEDNEVLTASIPIEIEEIEYLMNKD